MFDDLKEYLREWFKKVITSRLFVLAVVFCLMSSALVMRLFNLQIIKGEEYQDAYTAMTEKVIKTASTRGNIYDRNGNVLAYNELAYDVTKQDTGAYKTDAQWNTMLYDLVSILNKHGESAQTSLELTLDHDGNVVYTSETQSGRKRFLRDYLVLKMWMHSGRELFYKDLQKDAGSHPHPLPPRRQWCGCSAPAAGPRG